MKNYIIICGILLSSIITKTYGACEDQPKPDVDWSNCHIKGEYRNVDLSRAKFNNASLITVRFYDVKLDGAVFESANLDDVWISNNFPMGGSFKNLNFNNATLKSTHFNASNISNSTFINTTFNGINAFFVPDRFGAFINNKMDHAKGKLIFYDKVIQNTSFKNAHLSFGHNKTSTFYKITFRGYIDFSGAYLADINFRDVKLDTGHLNITSATLDRAYWGFENRYCAVPSYGECR